MKEQLKTMQEDMDSCKRLNIEYMGTINSLMEELQKDRAVIKELREVVKIKDDMIRECYENMGKAAKEDTYTQVVQSGRKEIRIPLPITMRVILVLDTVELRTFEIST